MEAESGGGERQLPRALARGQHCRAPHPRVRPVLPCPRPRPCPRRRIPLPPPAPPHHLPPPPPPPPRHPHPSCMFLPFPHHDPHPYPPPPPLSPAPACTPSAGHSSFPGTVAAESFPRAASGHSFFYSGHVALPNGRAGTCSCPRDPCGRSVGARSCPVAPPPSSGAGTPSSSRKPRERYSVAARPRSCPHDPRDQNIGARSCPVVPFSVAAGTPSYPRDTRERSIGALE